MWRRISPKVPFLIPLQRLTQGILFSFKKVKQTENSIAGEALVVAGGSRLSKNYRSGEFQPSKIRMNPRAQWNEKAWNYTDWQ